MTDETRVLRQAVNVAMLEDDIDWPPTALDLIHGEGYSIVPTATLEALERVRDAARFRASTTFTHFDPQPEGPDLLEAIAAYMDRQDDAAEARDGVAKDRTVQADVRRWAAALRAALGGPT